MHLYKRVHLSANFGLPFILLSYRTHQSEHLVENVCPWPHYLPRYDILNIKYSELI